MRHLTLTVSEYDPAWRVDSHLLVRTMQRVSRRCPNRWAQRAIHAFLRAFWIHLHTQYQFSGFALQHGESRRYAVWRLLDESLGRLVVLFVDGVTVWEKMLGLYIWCHEWHSECSVRVREATSSVARGSVWQYHFVYAQYTCHFVVWRREGFFVWYRRRCRWIEIGGNVCLVFQGTVLRHNQAL